MEQLAGVLLALLAAAVLIQLVQHGTKGVGDWLTAKLTGKTNPAYL